MTGPQLTGFKYLKKLLPLFQRLHPDGCARDKAGNRALHFDHYCALVLLYLFNPSVRSLRALQQASALATVQGKLGPPAPRSGRSPRPATSLTPTSSRGSSANSPANSGRSPRTAA